MFTMTMETFTLSACPMRPYSFKVETATMITRFIRTRCASCHLATVCAYFNRNCSPSCYATPLAKAMIQFTTWQICAWSSWALWKAGVQIIIVKTFPRVRAGLRFDSIRLFNGWTKYSKSWARLPIRPRRSLSLFNIKSNRSTSNLIKALLFLFKICSFFSFYFLNVHQMKFCFK
jgi:hypothetical protein